MAWVRVWNGRSASSRGGWRFNDVMIRFRLMEEHPAYNTILDAPVGSKRDQKTRNRLRERIANVIRTRRAAASQEQAYRVACVSPCR
jgi:hypothetical protein